MRKQLYTAVSAALEAANIGIRHIDLWNENTDYLEQEMAWGRPAVFVEFDDIEWQAVKDQTLRCRSTFRLHIVTDWNTAADSLSAFDLSEQVQRAVEAIGSTERFGNIRLAGSLTNHNHEDLLETTDIYQYTGVRDLSAIEPDETTEQN